MTRLCFIAWQQYEKATSSSLDSATCLTNAEPVAVRDMLPEGDVEVTHSIVAPESSCDDDFLVSIGSGAAQRQWGATSGTQFVCGNQTSDDTSEWRVCDAPSSVCMMVRLFVVLTTCPSPCAVVRVGSL